MDKLELNGPAKAYEVTAVRDRHLFTSYLIIFFVREIVVLPLNRVGKCGNRQPSMFLLDVKRSGTFSAVQFHID